MGTTSFLQKRQELQRFGMGNLRFEGTTASTVHAVVLDSGIRI